MKISFNWLKQYTPLPNDPAAVAEMLTGCGLEVEGMETYQTIKGGLAGMVIGEVLEKVKHPNADKLCITKVNIGDGQTYQIVCGAPNVETGQKVVVATVGATLYPLSGEPFEIKKSKIRGEVSEGMICAEDEIGLGHSHAGIMVLPFDARVGEAASVFFKLENDTVFEIGLTPNRADAASHIGVARDITAVWNAMRLIDNNESVSRMALTKPEIGDFQTTIGCPVAVQVENPTDCTRYSGICLSKIEVTESPSWLKERLQAVGLKSINTIVDLTSFVMLETGQPLHAFDADKISDSKILVMKLPAQTPFVTLDGTERKLNGEELMICDPSGGLCIAGIYGGLHSGVSQNTRNIFLESAYFNPTTIRKGSKVHGLKTDASFRFERGTDPELTVYALQRFVQLLQQIQPGVTCSEILDQYPVRVEPAAVSLDFKKLEILTGVPVAPAVVREILTSLEIKIKSENTTGMELEVPAFKPDVKRPVDVMEEILRIYGYNRVPLPSKMQSSLPQFHRRERLSIQLQISSYLAAQGFYEMMGNSLTRSDYGNFTDRKNAAVKLLNPLSNDLAILRQSLLFSGMETLSYNRNRKNPDLRFFEFGKIYYKEKESFREENHLSLLLAGKRDKAHWMAKGASYSLYYLKSIVQNALTVAGIYADEPFLYKEENDELYAVSLACYYKQKLLARTGIIKKQIAHHFDLDSDLYAADIAMDEVLKVIHLKDITIREAPKYPEVKRDLSMILDQHIRFESVEKTARETERKLLKSVQLFDVYQGDKMEAGKKSYAVSFILGDDHKTLEDKQIDGIMDRLMKNFAEKLGAVIRRG